MSEIPPITAVIPTYNQIDLLAKCVESLRNQDHIHRFMIVDDSGDGDFANCLDERFPDVQIIHHKTNRGFACAANAGIRAADTEWVLLLNDDMTLEVDCAARMAERMARGDVVGVGPLILNEDGSQIYAAGDRVLRNGRPESIGFRQPREGFVFDETPFGITAGCALYSRKFLDEMGGFDERFTAYFEDADLCMRARLRGHAFAVQHDANARHVGSASIEGRTWWRTRQCFRNHLLMVKTNFPLFCALRFYFPILNEYRAGIARTFRAVRADRGAAGAIAEVLKVHAEIIALIPHIIRKRWKTQRNAHISSREFAELLTRPGQ